MTLPDLDAELQRFLYEHIESYEELETLLALASAAEREWTEQELAQRLGIPLASVQGALERLRSLGLARSLPSGAAGSALDPRRALLVEQLARVYESQRVTVMRLLTAQAIERVRNRALHLFANSFVVGKRKEPDG